ncbi:hypothetical protein MPOCJGCO_0080 [Methylobacterium trifolii]|uniref:Uncharacterized protein n=1 Tax=Methylobacterium trifolii TaxID=1003092 RepID=A0ABQ4TRM6_9HYPH|nr:hypothetical protein MPOCJGCO_0080 [Methylobacterium trifolii]
MGTIPRAMGFETVLCRRVAAVDRTGSIPLPAVVRGEPRKPNSGA